MQEAHVVHTFQRNPEEEIRFFVKEYKGRPYFGLRLWFQPRDGGPYRPTLKGLTLSVEHLSEFRKGLEEITKAAAELPLQTSSKSLQSKHLEKQRNPSHG